MSKKVFALITEMNHRKEDKRHSGNNALSTEDRSIASALQKGLATRKLQKSDTLMKKESWTDAVESKFERCNDVETFTEIRELLRKYGTGNLKKELGGFVAHGLISTSTEFYNIFARVASGLEIVPEEVIAVQKFLGPYEDDFAVLKRGLRCDLESSELFKFVLYRTKRSDRHRIA